eukprot:sb/3473713/
MPIYGVVWHMFVERWVAMGDTILSATHIYTFMCVLTSRKISLSGALSDGVCRTEFVTRDAHIWCYLTRHAHIWCFVTMRWGKTQNSSNIHWWTMQVSRDAHIWCCVCHRKRERERDREPEKERERDGEIEKGCKARSIVTQTPPFEN